MPSTPVAPAAPSLREAVCLAHAVPGVTLRLRSHTGDELLVSYVCLGADLDPCHVRQALAHPATPAARQLLARVQRVEFVAGLRPLGAGLYQRRHAGVTERWFVTTLAPEQAAAALADGPPGFHSTIKPDRLLGVHAVCLRRDPADRREPPAGAAAAAALDDAAVRALSALLTAELTAELAAHAVGHSDPAPHAAPPPRQPSPPAP